MRILFTWELGSNYGHLARLIPLAQDQAANGNEVLFAVTNLQVAQQLLEPENIKFVVVPKILPSVGQAKGLTANYAEMLMNIGYQNVEALFEVVIAWIRLIEQFQADLIVTDYSPSALLAARITKTKAIQLGGGFEIPPKEEWSDMIPLTQMQRIGVRMTEQKLLTNINQVLKSCNAQPLNKVTELFDECHQLLTTFSELDHYSNRKNAHYIGPIYSKGQGQAVAWEECFNKKVFVYAWPGLPGLNQLMLTLVKLDVEVVAVIPNLSDEAIATFSADNIRIFGEPINYSEMLRQTDLLITHSGFGTLSSFLKGGVPVLVIPETLEQLIIGQKVASSKMGLMMSSKRSADQFIDCIAKLLHDPQYKQAALTFSAKYAHWSDDEAIKRATLKIDELLSLPTNKYVFDQSITTVQ